MHRGDLPAVRQALVNAQRLRPAMTYGLPTVAVQARLGLIRVHLALADITGARTLMGKSTTSSSTGPTSARWLARPGRCAPG
jgi:hypothetical protein